MYPQMRASKSQDAAIRLMAVRALHMRKDAAAIEVLVRAAGDEDMFVRGAAAEALSALDSNPAVDALISAVAGLGEPSRYVLLEGLSKMSSPRAEKFLVELATSHPDKDVRQQAVMALWNKRGSAVTEACRMALADSDSDVRFAAAGCLGSKDEEQAIPLLEAALCDPAESVQWVAASSLARIGNARALPSLLRRLGYDLSVSDSSQIIASLADVVRSGEEAKAVTAAASLQLIGGERVILPLKAGLQCGRIIVSGQCADALARLGTRGAIAALIFVLGDSNSNAFLFAALALRDIKCLEAVPALVRVVTKCPYTEPQCTALDALGRIGGSEAAAVVSGALASKYSSVRDSATAALGDLGDPAFIPILAAMLRDPRGSRRQAADALWKIGGEQALQALLEGVDGP